ncbi:MAG: exo-alpha-sialidase [Firmicutes bacterium]|nr:exo-alpha-sialidase [Bacillota bacterium]
MITVRVLVGTRKGAFVLTADADRRTWTVDGPVFGGWEVFHVEASPADPDRVYAALWTAWHGAVVQRSDDGGRTWSPVGNQFAYADGDTVHQGFDGKPQPWRFTRIWHLEPSPEDRDVVYAGVEDAALFRSTDGGATWRELPALRRHRTAPAWAPGAGGMGLHSILLAPDRPGRLHVAISAAGVFRSDDGGQAWAVANRGLRAPYLADPEPEAGYCVHKIAMHPSRPDTLFAQKHYGVYRSDDAGTSWTRISGNLPSDFGFPIAVHAHEPQTIYVVPMTSDSEHFPPDGALRVWCSRQGDGVWEPLDAGLPARHCYVNVLREAMAVDRLDPCGIYVGTTGGQLYASRDAGAPWEAVVTHLPPVLSVEVQTLGRAP